MNWTLLAIALLAAPKMTQFDFDDDDLTSEAPVPTDPPQKLVAQIRAGVRAHRKELIACQLSSPTELAKVRLEFVITPAGTTSSVKTDAKSKPYSRCLEKAVAAWTFPAVEWPVLVRYPVILAR